MLFNFDFSYLRDIAFAFNMSSDQFNIFLNKYNLHGNFVYDDYPQTDHYNLYDYIPLILEEKNTNNKKILCYL